MLERKVYAFWTGDNDIPENRKRGFDSLDKTGLEVVVVTEKNLGEYINRKDLHPAYYNLNLAHRADYLRAYFMHHFGGGYSDVKKNSDSWVQVFDEINKNKSLLAAGYREVSRHGVGNIYQSSRLLEDPLLVQGCNYIKWRWLQLNYRKTIGNCAFIFKPKTVLTEMWWTELNRRLDFFEGDLMKNPAKHHKERRGAVYNGLVSKYPLPWSYILADILQPLTLRFSSRISRELPAPTFCDYQ